MFINEECGNFIVVNDRGELKEKGRRFTIAYKCRLSGKYCGREYFFSNLWNIYCKTVR